MKVLVLYNDCQETAGVFTNTIDIIKALNKRYPNTDRIETSHYKHEYPLCISFRMICENGTYCYEAVETELNSLFDIS